MYPVLTHTIAYIFETIFFRITKSFAIIFIIKTFATSNAFFIIQVVT